MDGRQLLELAARAAGITYEGDEGGEPVYWIPDLSRYDRWNPLESDADCFRLETSLFLIPECWDNCVDVMDRSGLKAIAYFKDHNNDANAARRYASTTVAAEIDKRVEG